MLTRLKRNQVMLLPLELGIGLMLWTSSLKARKVWSRYISWCSRWECTETDTEDAYSEPSTGRPIWLAQDSKGQNSQKKIARATPGFVGADLNTLADVAGNLAMKRIIYERRAKYCCEHDAKQWTCLVQADLRCKRGEDIKYYHEWLWGNLLYLLHVELMPRILS
jgi:hypothetical protein